MKYVKFKLKLNLDLPLFRHFVEYDNQLFELLLFSVFSPHHPRASKEIAFLLEKMKKTKNEICGIRRS